MNNSSSDSSKILTNFEKTMQLLSALTSYFSNSPESKANKYLQSNQVYDKQSTLPLTFQYELVQTVEKLLTRDEKRQFIYQILNSINNSDSELSPSQRSHKKLTFNLDISSCVKLLTVIHNLAYELNYNTELIAQFQDIRAPIVGGSGGDKDSQESEWFNEFVRHYCKYLKKLPSMSDLYVEAMKWSDNGQSQRWNSNKQALQQASQQDTHQTKSVAAPNITKVFRIINHVSLLYPYINTSTNIVGRYYLSSHPEFPEFYRMINKEITCVYSYLKQLIDEILKDYKSVDSDSLGCFMKTVPEIQLICDKMEDMLLNKYFRGKSLKSKIFFNEEKIQEIKFYLQYEAKGKSIEAQTQPTNST